LEAVLPRLNSAVEGGDLIIQASSRDLAQRQNYLAKLQSLLARPPRPDAGQGEEYRRQFADLFSQQGAALSDISILDQIRKEYEVLNVQLEELRKALPRSAQSDDALARWPREVTRERVEGLESELRIALAQPVGILQRLWHSFRRTQVEAQRKVAREPLLSFPLLFADRVFPDVGATSDTWNDFFTPWKTLADAARISTLVRSCEQRIAQLPLAEDCNRRLLSAQQGIEEKTGEWMRWAAGGLPSASTNCLSQNP